MRDSQNIENKIRRAFMSQQILGFDCESHRKLCPQRTLSLLADLKSLNNSSAIKVDSTKANITFLDKEEMKRKSYRLSFDSEEELIRVSLTEEVFKINHLNKGSLLIPDLITYRTFEKIAAYNFYFLESISLIIS